MKRLSGQAAHRAQALQRALAKCGIVREVVPMLVLWGPAAHRRYPEPDLVGPPRVVAGRASKDWLPRMQAAATTNGAIDHPACNAVRQIIEDAEGT